MPITKVLSSFGNKLSERWIATLFTPAFAFWLGGGAIYLQLQGWNNPARKAFNALSDPIKITVLTLLLLSIAASGFIVQRFDWIIIRWMEGYWPKFMRPLRSQILKRQNKRLERDETRRQQLALKAKNTPLNPDELEDFSQLDWQLTHQIPEDPASRMPTHLGNILRAAELAPQLKYGLNSVLCWPHLWMLLPEQARTDVATARADLDTAARLWLWSKLFCLWSISAFWAGPPYIALWPIVVGGFCAWLSYRWAINAAQNYASLVCAAYDLYRFNLYESMKLKVPETRTEEIQMAEKLNSFLLRGY
ncbi:MAG: hypothetical protein AAFP20_00865 [Cyanobacteria bacterium J06614_10]